VTPSTSSSTSSQRGPQETGESLSEAEQYGWGHWLIPHGPHARLPAWNPMELQQFEKTHEVLMLRIELSHTLPVSVAEAFPYITDMKNWPEYWPNFIRIENPSAARWSNPGDKSTVVIKLLNRQRALNMELEAFQKDTRVTYVSRQRGLPDVRHERHFKAAQDGCVYRLVVEYEPRPGFAGLFDRLLVRRSVERAMRRTVRNLDRIFQKRRARA
jgi:polyketide cyclase/dehydrase/lipid transport protein